MAKQKTLVNELTKVSSWSGVCGNPQQPTPEFVEWIKSINHDFNFGKIKYKLSEYEAYKQQARNWLLDDDDINTYSNSEDQKDWVRKKKYRCSMNTLYAVMYDGHILEPQAEEGEIHGNMLTEAQMVICFIIDIGMSFFLAKPRQMGLTSVMGMICAMRLNYRKKFLGKFITYNDKKATEIFNDKVKYPYGRQHDNLRRIPSNDRDNLITVRVKTKTKGQIKGVLNRMRVEVATPAAIVGGSPNEVYIDEAAWIECLGQMLREQRPTMYFYNPKTGNLEFKRQVFIWSSGASQTDEDGNQAKGGADMEEEWKALKEAFDNGDYSSGIIPIFMNWTARMGATAELREQEKRAYYKTQGANRQQSIIQFHQAWPESPDDVFMRSDNTIVDHEYLHQRISEIYDLQRDGAIKYGYFEPVYDTRYPFPDGFVVPYKIIGANFIQTSDLVSRNTTCVMISEPDPRYKNRYYQGTDPINSETGHSYFSSSIYDDLTSSTACTVFYRTRNFRECYVQAILMGVYYDTHRRKGVPDLIEDNIGDDYKHHRDVLGFGDCVVLKASLPKNLQGGAKTWGVNKKNNAGVLYTILIDYMDRCGKNIKVLWFWLQIKNFVQVSLKSQSYRETKFAPKDKKRDRDDAIDSVLYSHICASCFPYIKPSLIEDDKKKAEAKSGFRRTQSRETGWSVVVKKNRPGARFH